MNPEFAELRVRMVDGQVRTTDVTDNRLLDAMLAIPREAFVEPRLKPLAYIDEDLEIAPGRFMMEPSPFAKLVQLADVGASERVLDIGCGTGYSTAVLALIAEHVTGVESEASLAEAARTALASLGASNATVVVGPLTAGHADGAPYDVILINGAVDAVPPHLFDQLREGGRLVAVEGRGNAGTARLYVKSGGVVAGRRGFNAAVKPLPGFERTPAFQF